MRVEMVARTKKSKRYKHLVCPIGFYHSLKDSPCCSEWIDVRMLQVGFKKYTVGIDPFSLHGHHRKTLEKDDF